MFQNRVHNEPSKSLKVVDFWHQSKMCTAWDFLVHNSNSDPILHCFSSIPKRYSSQNFGVIALSRSVMLGSAESEHIRITNCKIIF